MFTTIGCWSPAFARETVEFARRVFILVLLILPSWTSASAQYAPPLGIPAPPFGINESHQQYAGKTFAAGGFAYNDAGNGPYSHYINGGGACSDAGNPFGTATSPRCTIPATLAAGSVVELHGGPYAGLTITSSGTAAAPVFIRGVGTAAMPLFNSSFRMAGNYAIAEYIQVSPGLVSLEGNDLSIRHSRVHTHPTGVGALVVARGARNVVFRNELDHNGGIDRHGVTAVNTASQVWILENNIHDNSGDGIQFCHNCVPGPSSLYIGRNTIHDNHENAVDIKATVGPVVISENDMYGYWPTGTSHGDAVRVNDEGTQGKIWILANNIHDSDIGIEPEHNHSAGVFIIGNRIWNTPTKAIGRGGRNFNNVVIGNTIHNVGIAIMAASEIRNNVISNAVIHIPKDVPTGCSHNLVWQGGASPTMLSPCANVISADPQFLNASAGDFRVASTSPTIDVGAEPLAYAQYRQLYGIDITYDFLRTSRPRATGWDLGAFEADGTILRRPATPTNLRIVPGVP